MAQASPQATPGLLAPAVLAAALGYFVDIYDLLLFSIVRKDSLTDLGIVTDAQLNQGVVLLDLQMGGMLIGGMLWGILGDKKGRLSVLFASIVTYSLANLANGFVTDIYQYAICRFVAGIGLAGELGVGITLVAEIMPKEKRGYATTLVASIGILGAVLAGWLASIFDWRTCYIIGGVMGLSLLAMRFGVRESGLYAASEHNHQAHRGDFLLLFKSRERFLRYLRYILIGLPVWFVVGILVTFSPELQQWAGATEEIKAGKAVLFCYAGLSFGDMVSGLLSQRWKSRKKALLLFWGLSVVGTGIYGSMRGLDATGFYILCAFCGFTVGSWVIFMTVAAEQFGTNLRATVTTTVPNFVRGAVVPMVGLFHFLQIQTGNIMLGAMLTGVIVLSLAIWAISGLEETYGKDLDFQELA